jgi:hypothetical protein
MVELSVAPIATAAPAFTIEFVSTSAVIVLNVPLTEIFAPIAVPGPCPPAETAAPTEAETILLFSGLPAWLDSAATVTPPPAVTVELLISASINSAIWFQPSPAPSAKLPRALIAKAPPIARIPELSVAVTDTAPPAVIVAYWIFAIRPFALARLKTLLLVERTFIPIVKAAAAFACAPVVIPAETPIAVIESLFKALTITSLVAATDARLVSLAPKIPASVVLVIML